MKRNLPCLSILCLLVALICNPSVANAQRVFKDNSMLRSGEWHKIAVPAAGVYKIDYNYLSNTLGLNLAGIDPREVRLFGNRGGALPQRVDADRIDDIEEIAVYRSGAEDGSFDAGDYMLFYAEGPNMWSLDASDRFEMSRNVYAVRNHYFITILQNSGSDPMMIPNRPTSLELPDITVTTFDDYARLETERVNLLGKFRPPGSGQQWFGDEFSATRQRSYDLTFPNIVEGSDVLFDVVFAGRSGSTTTFYANVNGIQFSKSIAAVDLGEVDDDYASLSRLSGVAATSDDHQTITINYPAQTSSNTGWIDYISLQVQRELRLTGAAMSFRKITTEEYGVARYEVANATANTQIWDITDPHRPINQEFDLISGTAAFQVSTSGELQEYVAMETNGNFAAPEYSGKVENQNLHSILGADLLVVYHSEFEEDALRLAEHRRNFSGYRVVTAEINEVLNEFSGGSMDPTAIRDFAVMLKNRDADFRFLLLVGDGTYDMRHIVQDHDDDNFIPVFETEESMDPIRSFPSDDYYALLNDTEGESLQGAIDIAVGRLTVGSKEESKTVVDKIIHYDLGKATLGDWRLKLIYVADDEDSNLHFAQSEDIATDISDTYEIFNLKKIYADAFRQVSTPGGERYPDVNTAINNSIQKGALIINYLGHGGHLGWSQERILGITDIQGWNNYDRLPLFVTATCSFTGYDEPSYASAGEQVLLSPVGGAVALLTTVRAVYAHSNKRLTQAVFDRVFEKDNGAYRAIGEVMRLAKNAHSDDTTKLNARKFAIIGDPSMHLALPENNVVLTHVNNVPVTGELDTLHALDAVSLKGEVRDQDGQKLGLFNGKVFVSVYDKPALLRTLGNDAKSYPRDFEDQTRIVFTGSASITNGEFEIAFRVPKDINFSYGKGKVSMYATDEVAVDAAGSFHDIVIGGISSNTDPDITGPDISLFMNNTAFVSGDVVSPNSTLIVQLSDESGINVIGNSIGHDLEAVLDNDKSYILNDFYIARTDDFTSGEARYPFQGLAPGMHEITVIAWDAANNFSEATITFIVDENPGEVIRHVYNQPNPLTFYTEFGFEHSLQHLSSFDVYVDIFEVGGRLVRTVAMENVPATSGVVNGIEWDGSSTSRDPLVNGIYFYQVRVEAGGTSGAQQVFTGPFGKLVIVNR